jgi:protein SCO1/2
VKPYQWRTPAAGAFVALAVFFWAVPSSAQQGAPPPFPVIGRTAPDVSLTDHQGRHINLDQFRGRLVLLNFIYTSCTDVCPITTAMLTRVQRGLISRGWWARDVVFLTITTDPARDTTAVLATYARRYQADARGWHFLTGDPSTLRKIYRAYGITVKPSGAAQEHDLPTFVIDRKGVVLGAYGLGFASEDVLRDLQQLRGTKGG